MSEPTHIVRIVGRVREGTADVVVVETQITEGMASAMSLGPAITLYSPLLVVEPLTSAKPATPHEVELGEDWDHVLDLDVWRFIANALQTAATRYHGESVVHSSESQRASYERLAQRAEVIADAVERAIDNVRGLEA